jgi:uncharacterized protein YndB with AHSA1/START domain
MKHADASAESTDSIVVECDLDESPEKVWRALTEPELMAQWLTSSDVDEPLKPNADIECEVIEAEPHRLLRYSWRGGENDRDGYDCTLDTVVTFTLTETVTGGTHLRVVHSGFKESVCSPSQAAEWRMAA